MHTAYSALHAILAAPTPLPQIITLAAMVVAGGALVLVGARWRPGAGENCRRCGWPRGSDGCRHSHRLNPRSRAWSRREWERYQKDRKLPWWDAPSRRDRRRSR